MIEARMQQILSTMTALRKERYSNKDMLQEAIDFEHELYRAAFDGECVDKPRFSDVINRLMELDTQAGGIITDKISQLNDMLAPLGEQISICLAGGSGERKTSEILTTLRCKNAILRNVELTAEHRHCEIDLLVITPKIVFCIEVKNHKYDTLLDANGNLVRISDGKMYDSNLGERVRWREHILRTVLAQGIGGNSSLPEIKTYVVSANPRIRFVNEFVFVDSCCNTVIANMIEKAVRESEHSESDTELLRDIVRSAIDVREYPVDIDIESIRLLFAEILATLECVRDIPAVEHTTEQIQQDTPSGPDSDKPKSRMISSWLGSVKHWFVESPVPRYAGTALAGAFVGGFITKLKFDGRR